MASLEAAAVQNTPNTAAVDEIKTSSAPAPQVEAQKASAPAEAKTEENKPNTPANAEPQKTVVPEKYDLKLPEGSHLGADALEKVSALAKAKGLSNEDAQAILEGHHSAVSAFVDAQNQTIKATTEKWVEDVRNDPEIGGAAFNESVEMAKRVVQKFASEPLKKTLNETGLGNNPELVRFCARIAKEMSEDKMVLPGGQAGGNKKAMEDIFYGGKTATNKE